MTNYDARLVFGFLPNPCKPISTPPHQKGNILNSSWKRNVSRDGSNAFDKADVIPPCKSALHDTNQLLALLTYPGEVAAIPGYHGPLRCTILGFIPIDAHDR